jgi:hypothetical protein
MDEAKKRSPRSLGLTAFGLFILGIAPMLLTLVSGWIANSQKCVLNEGGESACQLFGVEIGGILYTAFTLGWLTLITIWLVPIAIVMAVVAFIGWWRERG